MAHVRNMKRYTAASLALAALLVASGAGAQEPPVSDSDVHCFWQVQGQHNTVWLLGSIHVLSRTNYPLADVIETAFKESPVTAFETDLYKMKEPAMEDRLAQEARLAPGQTLRQVLRPAVYQRFNQQVRQIGLPGDIFDHTKPFVAAITIEVFALKKLGFDPEYGIDRYFFDRARNQGKTVVPLETPDFQFHLITDLTPKEGEILMETTLEDIDNTRELFGDLLHAWETGDALKLEKLLHYSMRDAPELYKRMVTDRNERWVAKIEQLLSGNQNALVVVGAGHLVGQKGLVQLLKDRGWNVVQR